MLYAFFTDGEGDYAKGEKELMGSIDRSYDQYIYYLSLFDNIWLAAEKRIEDGKNKRLPSKEDLSPNYKFLNNRLLKKINNNNLIIREAEKRKISWKDEQELVRKVFGEIRNSEFYTEYMDSKEDSFELDKKFLVKVFKKIIANSELIHHHFEELSIYWIDDIDIVCSMVIKTMKKFNEDDDQFADILPKYKDPVDEINFIKTLFRVTIKNNDELEKLIEEKTKNWDLDRIAMLDMILLKMALTEAMEFEQIPTKVSLNEYIEIAKYYSTPKSNGFINGVLDKAYEELKESGKIKKIGRGIVE